MKPLRTARTSASEVIAHLGDYTTLLCSVAMTAVVAFALHNVGSRNVSPASFKHLLQPRVFISEIPTPPTFAQASSTLAQAASTLMHAPSAFRQELRMSPSQLVDRWNPVVAEASRRFGVSADWIRAVIRQESGGRTVLAGGKPIISHAGAVGIMQMMPETYRAMRARYRLGANPSDPHDNVIAGTAYLRWLYHRYGFPNMFAAYNGGPGKLEEHLQTGAPLPEETQNYIASVTHMLGAPEQQIRHRGRVEVAALGGRHHRLSVMVRG
jgi:soluble lytic murein transglycosylase-like protein